MYEKPESTVELDFRSVVFPDYFNFRECFQPKFGKTYLVDFTGATFGGNVDFSNVRFGAEAKFTKVTFEGEADFTYAVFGSFADFSRVKYKDKARFFRATFDDNAIFSNAIFGKLADFTRTTFGTDNKYTNKTALNHAAKFSGTTFKDSVYFSHATFGTAAVKGTASFVESTFEYPAIFKDTTFQGDAKFSVGDAKNSEFAFREIDFSNAKFFGTCSFENRNFKTNASFNNAIFHDLVEFHGCTFHQGMSFHKTEFHKTQGGYDAEGFEIDSETEALERSYRTLKLGMETLRARNEEAMFFGLEMECRRNRRDVGLFEHFVAFSYKKLSNYGQSILKPLVWLTGFTALMWCVYYVTGKKTLTDLVLDVISGKVESWEIAKFTIEQMFRPFFVWSKDSSGIRLDLFGNGDLLIPILASLQSLATLSLLALFLLALRRRFKMD